MKAELFQDSQGNESSKRVQSMMCFITAIVIGIASLFIKGISTELATGLVWAFLIAGAALQGITIFQEMRK